MRTATVTLKSVSPYSSRRFHNTPKLDKEGHDDHEKRTWREGVHVGDDGEVVIPPFALKNCIAEAAKYLGMKIQGKNRQTYTKHFDAGVLVLDSMGLGIKKQEVEGLWLFVPSDGKKGGKSRVMKCFPTVREWVGTATFFVLDDTITEDVFAEHLDQAGKFIGLGSLRVRNGGIFGRFEVEKIEWS